MIDYKSLARLLLTSFCIRENSYNWEEEKYTISAEMAAIQACDGDKVAGEFIYLAAYWANDLQTWAEISFGLVIKRRGGELILVDGEILMGNGEPMLRGAELYVDEVEPGEEAYCNRHDLPPDAFEGKDEATNRH